MRFSISQFYQNRLVTFFRAIVGAPEAETAQTDVYRGGAVYKCDIAADDRCNIIHFDDKGKWIIISVSIERWRSTVNWPGHKILSPSFLRLKSENSISSCVSPHHRIYQTDGSESGSREHGTLLSATDGSRSFDWK